MDEIEKWRVATTTAHLVGAGLRIGTEPKPGKCQCCKREMPDVSNRRRNTAYANDELNWLESCGECFELDTEHFNDLWSDYYGSIM